jgi:hypothetical protein
MYILLRTSELQSDDVDPESESISKFWRTAEIFTEYRKVQSFCSDLPVSSLVIMTKIHTVR